jgi:trimeric autotransporter adhesin
VALSDRADLLAERLKFNEANGPAATASLTLYEDKTTFFNNGRNATATEAVMFGDTEVNDLGGRSGNDHLYGGAGNDILQGARGQDYLEGNADDDQLFGGLDNDRLLGGAGIDALDGGEGNDTLNGGLDDDVLKGGVGTDKYQYRTGFGNDQIDDVDGKGTIQFDLQTLLGGIRQDGDPVNAFVSPDGQFTFVKSGNDLIINGTLTVKNFIDGQLGLRLADASGLTDGVLPTIDYANGFPTFTKIDGDSDDTEALLGNTNYVVHGNGGNDFILTAQGNDQLFGGMGHDALQAGSGQDQLLGDEGNDSLNGNAGQDVLYGGLGNDVLNGDTINDLAVVGDDYLDGGAGDDLLQGQGGDDALLGGEGNDILIADDDAADSTRPVGRDYLEGGDGLDKLYGGLGDDQLLGDTGDDRLFGDNIPADPSLLVTRFSFNGGQDFLDGGDGSDFLQGDGGDDIVLGGAGNDQLYGDDQGIGAVMEGADWLDGGDGDDQLYGGGGLDTLIGGRGDDLLSGGAGDDVLTGGPGNDRLIGGAGVDSYLVGVADGQDTIEADSSGSGFIVLDDDILPDAVTVNRAGLDIVLNFPGGFDRLTIQSFYQNPSFQVQFTDGTLWDANAIHARAGNLQVGMEGSDTLFSFVGLNDRLSGLGGDDTYVVNDIGDIVIENDQEGFDTVTSSVSYTLPSHVENLTLVGAATSGIGNDLDNVLQGGTFLDGKGGNDTLSGLTGAGTLLGGEGTDLLLGSSSNDVLDGGLGDDILEGGQGHDTYVFGLGSGHDTAFEQPFVGDIDTIELTAGIAPGDVMLRTHRSNSALDLLVTINGSSDQLLLRSALEFGSLPFENITFADGTVWDTAMVESKIQGITITASSNDGESLFGTGRNDVLTGGEGNDFLNGEEGADALSGGLGNDGYQVDNTSDVVVELPGQGRDYVSSSVDYTLPDNVEDLYLDALVGIGNAGDNTLVGNPGNNILFGGAGNDRLWGGYESAADNDELNGGVGDDAYYIDSLDNGIDTVHDVSRPAEGNRIQFGPSIRPADVDFVRNSNSLFISVGTSGGGLLLADFDPTNVSGSMVAETVEFSAGLDSTKPGYEVTLTSLLAPTLGTEANDDSRGTANSDLIRSGAGDDRITGGGGNDVLSGGAGQDTYVFNLGDGFDLIDDVEASGEENAVEFGAGIRPEDLHATYKGNGGGLVLHVGNGNDALQLGVFVPDSVASSRAVDQFQFADGSVRSLDQLLQSGVEIEGTLGDDILRGTFADNRLSGFGGADYLSGGPGNDTLIGGPGNDQLSGGGGADTYVFHLGDGHDRIDDADEFTPSSEEHPEGEYVTNLIRFGPGITLADLTFVDIGGVLGKILVGINGDAIDLPNLIDGPSGIGTVAFSDGLTASIDGLISAGEITEDQILYAGPQDSSLIGGQGNDTLTASSGDISLIGGGGHDTLIGGSGYTTFYGGAGNDLMVAGSGTNAFVFSTGGGIDAIRIPTNVPTGNAIVFGGGYSLYNPRLGAGSLLVRYGTVGDELHIEGFDPNDVYRNPGIETFQFTDRTFTYAQFIDLGFDLQGTTGDDLISGTNVVDRIVGLDGNDRLSGRMGDDTLTGGHGEDALFGGDGNDTYVFGLGDGIDTIDDTTVPGDSNRIQFDTGISRQDLQFAQVGNTLTIQVGTAGDALRLNGFALNGINGSLVVETLVFADGSTVGLASLLGPVATEGDDVIVTGPGDDVIDAKGGNDVITTDGGNDSITGGLGDDILAGGPGDDTYIYGIGEGIDTIEDTVAPGEGNMLSFGPGITLTSLLLRHDQNGLTLLVGNSGDEIHLSNFNTGDAYGPHAIETFSFADGTTLSYSELIDRGFDLPGTAGDDTITGTNVVDRLNGLAGNDMLESGAGDDALDGGIGADIMTGGSGNDTYIVDDPGDIVTEALNEGIDTVQSALSYLLGANIENLTLTGTAGNATGNDVNNVLTGNSAANILDGGLGADTMTGEGGDDTYIVDNVDDLVVENFNEDLDTVQSTVTYTLTANVENLTLMGATAINGAGNAEDNTLVGNSGANILDGEDGNDTLTGSAGADTLSGDAGNDTLIGGTEADLLIGGAGDDTFHLSLDGIWTSSFAAKNSGSPGHAGTGQTAALNGKNRSFDVFDGGTGADTLLGTAGNDAIALDDSFSAFPAGTGPRLTGIELIQTGDGNDIVDLTSSVYGYGDVTLDGGNGDDVLWASAGSDLLLGGVGNDNLYGGFGVDQLVGHAGNDTLDGGEGADQLIGGLGNDVYVIESADDTVTELTNEGTDTVKSTISYTLGSNVENLTLSGTAAINGIGNGLNNTLTGNSAANVLAGELGNDTYVVGVGDTVIEQSDEGTDTVQSAVNWTLGDNLENLTLTGGAAINGTGNALNNTLTGNSVANLLTGGAGDDVYNVGAGDSVLEQVNDGIDTVKSAITWTLDPNVENLTLTGSTAIDGAGNALNNTLTGNSAVNVLTGGAGDDTYVVGVGDNVIENTNEGMDTVQSAVTFTLSDNVENLMLIGSATINATGNALDNVLTGNGAANVLRGGAGNDTYVVGSGDTVVELVNDGLDTVRSAVSQTLAANVENLTLTGTGGLTGTGNELNNVLTGNAGGNTLDGGGGNDTLSGGLGNDVLKGGTGNDTYLFNRGDGQDKISDIDSNVGNADTLLFGATINPIDLVLSRQVNDLRLAIHGSTDHATIQNWYGGSANQIETIQAGNGQQLLNTQVQQLIQAMATFSTQTGLTWDQAIAQKPEDVQAILAANWQS